MLSGHKNTGLEIGGVHYTIASRLLDSGIFEDEDCTGLSDFEVSDTSDENEEDIGHSPCRSMVRNENFEDNSNDFNISSRCKRDHEGIIKNKKEDNMSENSNSSSYSQNKSSHSHTSPTQDAKDDELKPPQIFGYYFCEVCNLDLSSEKVYNDHMNGQRHRKNLKLRNVDMAVYQGMPLFAATEGISKYPKPPAGVIRRKVKQRAIIQDIIKNEVKKPCPGLNLVTEIQGLKETQYYCSICNSICSSNSIMSHLTGFKHQLNLVKHFKPGIYENINPEHKNLVKDKIVGILRAIQKKNGLGRMTVEVEDLACDSNDISHEMSHSYTSRDVRSTSLKYSGMSFSEYYSQSTIPDKYTPGYHCEFCDSHMNSEDMWKAHIAGKRHIANLKKLPGDRPSKTKTIALNCARAKLLDRLEEECPEEPIVGLDKIREIILTTNSETYNCFICCSCHTSMDIIDHLVSLKHRKKFLDFIDYPYMQFISGMSEISSVPIIRSICSDIEARDGRHKPTVHIHKSSFSV